MGLDCVCGGEGGSKGMAVRMKLARYRMKEITRSVILASLECPAKNFYVGVIGNGSH